MRGSFRISLACADRFGTVLTSATKPHIGCVIGGFCVGANARWGSLVARRSHNPECIGSNPICATILLRKLLIADGVPLRPL
jgi:hypothetical protein